MQIRQDALAPIGISTRHTDPRAEAVEAQSRRQSPVDSGEGTIQKRELKAELFFVQRSPSGD